MRYFKGKQFKKDIIWVAVGYYCRFSLSYRDISEISKERGISVLQQRSYDGFMNKVISSIKCGK